jgi:hypothetical protein
MVGGCKKTQKPLAIKDLYPHLSPEEHAEAEHNIKRYVANILPPERRT